MNKKYNFILASASPRRKELLSTYIHDFKIMPTDIDESFPKELENENVPLYLAKMKAEVLKENLKENDIIITADTIVLLDDTIYGKPSSKEDAFKMIGELLKNKENIYLIKSIKLLQECAVLV